MRKSTIFLMALALALIPLEQTVVVAEPLSPDLPLRRSRFLANFQRSTSLYHCSNQEQSSSPPICRPPGSPGPMTCCGRDCVDTKQNMKHCGSCNRECSYGNECCGGHCVNTSADEKNCGRCGVKCRTKCTGGTCDYAA